jgi:hypothetical protein
MSDNIFSPERYVSNLNKQMRKYVLKEYLIDTKKTNIQISDPKKDISNYEDLLFKSSLNKNLNKKIKNI